MTDAFEPSQAGMPGEQWTLSAGIQIEELFDLLAIPPIAGYTPAAITAVGAEVSPTGGVAHYPVYVQQVEGALAEPSEVRAAIAILQRWLRMQRRSNPNVGTPWPPASGG